MATSERLHWGRNIVDTACPLDCPDNCSLSVTVETGRIVDIDGSRLTPTTNGFICAKVRGFAGRVYHEGRVKHPQKRRGPKGLGQFERISWDEAYERIAQEMEKARDTWGGESILPFYYGGSNGCLTQDSLDAELFRQLGTSRIARTLCAAATTAAQQAMYGRMPGVGYEDYEDARLIVVWGANPPASGMHLVPFIKRARQKGATLVVVDPRRTAFARQADLHVPGTARNRPASGTRACELPLRARARGHRVPRRACDRRGGPEDCRRRVESRSRGGGRSGRRGGAGAVLSACTRRPHRP